MRRGAQGVRLIRLDEGERVFAVAAFDEGASEDAPEGSVNTSGEAPKEFHSEEVPSSLEEVDDEDELFEEEFDDEEELEDDLASDSDEE